MKPLSIVILAAGLGSRMKSELPKPLHKIGGKPMLEHVLQSARTLNPTKLVVVFGHRGEALKEAFSDADDITWAEQKTFEGTGDAMRYALPYCVPESNVLVLYGDTPLINPDTLTELVGKLESTDLAWLTATMENPFGYGRIIRDHNDHMISIIEEKDANATEKAICEINTGIFATTFTFLYNALPKLTNQNQQNEYYLTDIAGIAVDGSINIETISEDPERIRGVNDRIQLAELEAYYQREKAKELMRNGITLDKPETLTIKGTVQNGFDCHIEANVVLEGHIVLGKNVHIGTGCVLTDVVIGDNTEIKPYTVMVGASVGKNASVGPFARIREKSQIMDETRIGNFVETKNTHLGHGSKASHLTYLGDADIGEHVNVGAGVITCNYDGVNKFKTTINNGAFIGSNSSLVAPVSIGVDATVAAGTVVAKDVPDHALALNKIEAKRISDWERPAKKKS